MADQDIHPTNYSELRDNYKYYINLYNALYQLKTQNVEELNSIFKLIKTELIDSRNYHPDCIMKDILNIIPYNNRYAKSYLTLAKLISNAYNVKQVLGILSISNFMFYKKYGIKLYKIDDFEQIKYENIDIHTEYTIHRAIMYNDIETFISFTEREGFDKDQKLKSKLYPGTFEGYSLLELCCYHGAVDCFKFLRTKFKSEITQICLQLSFLGDNQEIMSECLKYQKPNGVCMMYAIISHNIDFVTFLINEYKIDIDLDYCGLYNNLESFLVYFDQTHNFNKCFVFSAKFNISSLCEYFLSNGANINEKDKYGRTALHYAAYFNCKETAELLISHGVNINEKDIDGENALHYAARNNCKETAEFLISHGANIIAKNKNGKTAFHEAAYSNSIETAGLLISHGVNINEKDIDGETTLHEAAYFNHKETAELLISHGANINEKDKYGKTSLHEAAYFNHKEKAELLISHGANINEKDKYGKTSLHEAAHFNHKEKAELLISHGANINEKDKYGKTSLHIAAENNSKEIAELLISHGANINEKDKYGKTSLHEAAHFNCKEKAELLISHGANINATDKHGKTPLYIAKENKKKEMAELLISHGASIDGRPYCRLI
ncbi:ankyrin repeat protein, putative [Trichomonas vaginalis G3]|uniref:Ankyrin repeat protein, putative n=1 Tax=Trichomonas vaginalis (strain ATCC PRA-98 / G3) TaxID=412133 RepID=A2E2C7_TRIV3|nr:ankyrin repeat protein, putative [Trichomonas vaginalis G3]|eukprot:XP_001325450.1 ankyrin repeat protein [Trichomonas vaginalis G3]